MYAYVYPSISDMDLVYSTGNFTASHGMIPIIFMVLFSHNVLIMNLNHFQTDRCIILYLNIIDVNQRCRSCLGIRNFPNIGPNRLPIISTTNTKLFAVTFNPEKS